jgi:type I restriction enzyme S subunit
MAMRWRTYSDQFRDIKVAYPSIEEQHEILRYLDKKCTAIDTLISKKEQFLTELENYKKSLIYEYVTGKKEIL